MISKIKVDHSKIITYVFVSHSHFGHYKYFLTSNHSIHFNMASTLTHTLILLVVLVSLIYAESKQNQDVIVHEGKCTDENSKTNISIRYYSGQCPTRNPLIHIHCRRRVCRPEDMIPLCKSDGDCSNTQKCCRPMCSCRTRCVDAIKN